MTPICPACGRQLPTMALPVCAYCGARLAEPAPAVADSHHAVAESAEALLERYFTPAATYRSSRLLFTLGLLTPLLLPLAAVAMGAWLPVLGLRWLPPALTALAAILMLDVARRWPGRRAVTIDRRGIRCGRRHIPWEHVTGTQLVPDSRRDASEPAAIEILVGAGPPVRVSKDQTAGAAIRSLRNLAAAIDAVVAAMAAEERTT